MKRGRVEILCELLEHSIEPTLKTHLLYNSGVNFYQLTKYLNFMSKHGLIEELEDRMLRITPKGRLALKMLEQLKE